MNLDKQTLERIVKCVVMNNGQEVKFDKKFLELYDNVETKVVDMGDHIVISGKVVMK